MSATFTGSSYLSIQSVPASQTLKGSPVSLAIWVRPTSAGGTLIDTGTLGYYCGIVSANVDPGPPVNFKDTVAIFNDSGAGTWFLDLEQNEFAEELVDQGDATTLNAWVHYAATYNGTNTAGTGFVLYKNGQPITNTITGTAVTSTIAWDRVVVGGFAGDAQDAFVYNRVLTAGEISDLYLGRTQRVSTANIVGHWPLYGDNLGLDISGQGRNLTATGTVVKGSNNAPTSTWFPGSTRALRTLPTGTVVSGNSSGTTNTTGASNVQIGAASSGTTQTSGSSSVAIAPSGTGTTQTTGASAVQIQAATTGTTQTSGSSSVQIQAASAGLTQFTGASVAFINTPTSASPPSGLERRWSAVTGLRRAVRR